VYIGIGQMWWKRGKTAKNSKLILKPHIHLFQIHIVVFWFATLSKMA
jgi:hypothetical protein